VFCCINTTISIIEIGEHMDAYALVYREEYPQNIYLNPLLLMQLGLSEMRGATPEHMRKCALFIAVKIVHELSHLVHPLISERLRAQVNKRHLGEEGKRKMRTSEKSKNGAIFSDFGEMVEFDLCGGIMEIYTDARPPIGFFIDELVLYEHPHSREGRIVQVKGTDYEITDSLDDMRFTVAATTVNTPYRGPRGVCDMELPEGGEEEGKLNPTF
jgi:hypothetical protein